MPGINVSAEARVIIVTDKAVEGADMGDFFDDAGVSSLTILGGVDTARTFLDEADTPPDLVIVGLSVHDAKVHAFVTDLVDRDMTVMLVNGQTAAKGMEGLPMLTRPFATIDLVRVLRLVPGLAADGHDAS